MPRRFVLALAATLLAMQAQAAPSSMSDRRIAEDIASDAGMTPCQVRRALAEQFPIAAEQYVMHPSARGRIARLVRERHDAQQAEATTGSPRPDSCAGHDAAPDAIDRSGGDPRSH
ncbi:MULTISPECIES: hypothetical protein [unclassified Lysobacter]|uniref:hypothetical protein n=1 Tax=unclassified Lysobacter TaxID=2635362 RepID=UPI001BE6C89F|nr:MULTISPECIES: hypothetical protein [unclassified Lysobacter]MBT2747728.1 hypothetical protein [Lysobacter sp. ISL-42]MBT2754046.1 hypothetical protein [Lysobacter sp. ISL-50]MBT2779675.1 hypothetical protein [Lysobacter sp. ISL-54]MBT2780146.1 hypothetical protein [Lysobacter sp. ISL-52]